MGAPLEVLSWQDFRLFRPKCRRHRIAYGFLILSRQNYWVDCFGRLLREIAWEKYYRIFVYWIMQTFFTILLVLLGIGLVAMIVSFVLALIHSDEKEKDKNA